FWHDCKSKPCCVPEQLEIVAVTAGALRVKEAREEMFSSHQVGPFPAHGSPATRSLYSDSVTLLSPSHTSLFGVPLAELAMLSTEP
uniref:Uncharacterized protein n=1 Tax=Athene cunicularia TaxID=194338 RepID=A0A663LXW8_ATHCN